MHHNDVNQVIIEQPALQRVPSEVFSVFPNIWALSIAADTEEIPPGIFANATKLVHLSIEGRLRKLQAISLHPLKLNTLSIENNQIETIDEDTFVHQTDLEELSLADNKLRVIKRNTFSTLTSLTKLDLSGNEIQSIDTGAFVELARLEDLNLENNNIKVLDDRLFDRLGALKTLSIANNRIENVDRIMERLRNLGRLRKINIRGNNYDKSSSAWQNIFNSFPITIRVID